MPDDKPTIHPRDRTYAYIALGAMAAAIVLVGVHYWQMQNVSATPQPKQAYYPFQDANQTRSELIDIISAQRTRAVSAYALEYSFCMKHMGKEIKMADTTNIEINGSAVKELITCQAKDGSQQQWRLEFDAINDKYSESLILGSMA